MTDPNEILPEGVTRFWYLLCACTTDDEVDNLFARYPNVDLNIAGKIHGLQYLALLKSSSLRRKMLRMVFRYGAYSEKIYELFPEIKHFPYLQVVIGPNGSKLLTMLDNNHIIPYSMTENFYDYNENEISVFEFCFRYCVVNGDVKKFNTLNQNDREKKTMEKIFLQLETFTPNQKAIAAVCGPICDFSKVVEAELQGNALKVYWFFKRGSDVKTHLDTWLSRDVDFAMYEMDEVVNGIRVFSVWMKILLNRKDIPSIIRILKTLEVKDNYFDRYIMHPNAVYDEELYQEFRRRIPNIPTYKSQITELLQAL